MTPDQTQSYIERRLNDLGWDVRIGKTGYEQIQEFTDGIEDRVSQVYYKLVSIGSQQPKKQITEPIVKLAIDELQRMDEVLSIASESGGRGNGSDHDRMSIDQLASALEESLARQKPGAVAVLKGTVELPSKDRTAIAGKAEAGSDLPRILVVDDSPTIRAAVTKALTNYFTFVEANDGEEGWEVLQKRQDIELVITDLMMPRLDGYDLVKRIRAETAPPHLRNIPIIVVTALEDTNAKLRALVNGANDFITKNTDAAELQARVVARYQLAKNTNAQTRAKPRVNSAPVVAGWVRKGDYWEPAAPPPVAVSNGDAARAEPAKPATIRGPVSRPELVDIKADAGGRQTKGVSEAGSRLKRWLLSVNATTGITVGATLLLVLVIAGVLFTKGTLPTPRDVSDGPPQVAEGAAEQQSDTSPTPMEKLAATLDPSGDKVAAPDPETAKDPGNAAGRESDATRSSSQERANGTGAAAATSNGASAQSAAPARIAPPARPPETAPRLSPPARATDSSAGTTATVASGSGGGDASGARSAPQQRERAPEPASGQATDTALSAKPKPTEQLAATAGAGELSVSSPLDVSPGQSSTASDLPRQEPASTRTAASPSTGSSPAGGAADATQPGLRTRVPTTLVRQPARQPAVIIVATSANPGRIGQPELEALVRKFVFAYEAGDLEQFVSLFDDDVRTNDRTSKSGLREDYADLFRKTDIRQMALGTVQWEVDGEQAYGWGNFEVKVRNVGQQEIKAYKGSLTFSVARKDGRVKIKSLYHGQWRTGAG